MSKKHENEPLITRATKIKEYGDKLAKEFNIAEIYGFQLIQKHSNNGKISPPFAYAKAKSYLLVRRYDPNSDKRDDPNSLK